MSLIIYGPPGCGKTRNAEKIAHHFGLKTIIDGYDGGTPLLEDTLALTNRSDLVGSIDYDRVMRLIEGAKS